MKILLAADGSECTRRAAAWIVTHPELLDGGDVVLLHVQPNLPPVVDGFVGRQVVMDYHAQEAAKVLEPLETFVRRHGIGCRSRWVLGHPAHEIVKACASENAHLVLMGTHGNGPLATLLLGSVARNVLALSPVPVLFVK
jgi:nucleotide-binding universal stress UspA family protein